MEHPEDIQLQNGAIEQNLKQLRELRRYSEQIETALDEYEENIMKIEEEISNNTLCNWYHAQYPLSVEFLLIASLQ